MQKNRPKFGESLTNGSRGNLLTEASTRMMTGQGTRSGLLPSEQQRRYQSTQGFKHVGRASSNMDQTYEDDIVEQGMHRIGEASAQLEHRGLDDLGGESQDYFN